ncbi:hypothetical protein [Rhodococcus wratislaviensis]|nr:hypothetical protein [Rhodococcus wratislaviensis]
MAEVFGVGDERYKHALRTLLDEGATIGKSHAGVSSKVRLSRLTVVDEECQSFILQTSMIYGDLSFKLQDYSNVLQLSQPHQQFDVEESAKKRKQLAALNSSLKRSVSVLNLVAATNLKPLHRKVIWVKRWPLAVAGWAGRRGRAGVGASPQLATEGQTP